MTEFNWSKAWIERLARSSHKARLKRGDISSEEFWDRFGTWEEYERYTAYPGRALDRILECVDPQSTVLDIGAGSGAFTIPLAKAGRFVTAVEPSSGQLSRLYRKAKREGVGNFRVIQSRWEDVDAEEVGCHDIVTAAYCLAMEDIEAALDKMYRVVARGLFIVHFAGHDLLEPIREMCGGYDSMPDYIFLLNVLYEMGHRASVEVFTRDYELPLDLQLKMFGYSQGFSTELRGRIRHYLEANDRIRLHNGVPWVKRQYRDALIWIRKDER